MPIRGDRLRWPPRPGRKFSSAAPVAAQQPLQQPNERDESAESPTSPSRSVIEQAHADVKSGQQDTDCRNQSAEVIKDAPAISKRPRK